VSDLALLLAFAFAAGMLLERYLTRRRRKREDELRRSMGDMGELVARELVSKYGKPPK
jgi:hypothetical protein